MERYCRGVANHDESESEGDLRMPTENGGEDARGKKRKKQNVVRSDKSSSDTAGLPIRYPHTNN